MPSRGLSNSPCPLGAARYNQLSQAINNRPFECRNSPQLRRSAARVEQGELIRFYARCHHERKTLFPAPNAEMAEAQGGADTRLAPALGYPHLAPPPRDSTKLPAPRQPRPAPPSETSKSALSRFKRLAPWPVAMLEPASERRKGQAGRSRTRSAAPAKSFAGIPVGYTMAAEGMIVTVTGVRQVMRWERRDVVGGCLV